MRLATLFAFALIVLSAHVLAASGIYLGDISRSKSALRVEVSQLSRVDGTQPERPRRSKANAIIWAVAPTIIGGATAASIFLSKDVALRGLGLGGSSDSKPLAVVTLLAWFGGLNGYGCMYARRYRTGTAILVSSVVLRLIIWGAIAEFDNDREAPYRAMIGGSVAGIVGLAVTDAILATKGVEKRNRRVQESRYFPDAPPVGYVEQYVNVSRSAVPPLPNPWGRYSIARPIMISLAEVRF